MKPIIESPRLYLRELQASDHLAFFEMDADPEVHRFVGNSPIKTLGEASAAIAYIQQQYRDNGIGRYAIIAKDTDEFVGWGGFKLITESINQHQNYHDLGYRLLRKHWGKGYATESSMAAVDYAFHTLNIDAIYATANVRHQASLHVLEKCGLQRKEIFNLDGSPHFWLERYADKT